MIAIAIAPTDVAGTVSSRDLRPAGFPAMCGHRNKSGEVNLTPFKKRARFRGPFFSSAGTMNQKR